MEAKLQASKGDVMAKILIVDDHPDVTEILVEAFQNWGHEAMEAKCGQEALEIATAFKPQIVFVDVGLPDMSGLDVARQIRTIDPELLVVVSISGWCDPRDHLNSALAGCDRHMGKPFTMSQLNEVIERATGEKRTLRQSENTKQ